MKGELRPICFFLPDVVFEDLHALRHEASLKMRPQETPRCSRIHPGVAKVASGDSLGVPGDTQGTPSAPGSVCRPQVDPKMKQKYDECYGSTRNRTRNRSQNRARSDPESVKNRTRTDPRPPQSDLATPWGAQAEKA